MMISEDSLPGGKPPEIVLSICLVPLQVCKFPPVDLNVTCVDLKFVLG